MKKFIALFAVLLMLLTLGGHTFKQINKESSLSIELEDPVWPSVSEDPVWPK